MKISQFKIGENRSRPSYQVKTSRCVACGAPLSLYSECFQLIVCQHCGEKLDISPEEVNALGQSGNPDIEFELNLHQKFIWNDVRYKIIARILFEDCTSGIKTAEYFLFHPFLGTKWLSIYRGEDDLEFSISEEEHALALVNPFQEPNNSQISTGDQRGWNKESESELLLQYIDGTLPWIARIGDRTQTIEYVQEDDSRLFLTIEQTALDSVEIEHSFSREMSLQQYRKAIGEQSSGEIFREKTSDLMTRIHPFMRIAVLVCAILGLLIFGFLGFQSGEEDLASFSFSPEQVKLERGVISPSFSLTSQDIQQLLFIEYSGQSFFFPDVILLKVEKETEEYLDLKAWEESDGSDQHTVEETFVFYLYPEMDGKSHETFALVEEGIYRVHLRYSEHYQSQITENVTIQLKKRIPFTRYYLFMFACCIWTMLVWRKL